MRQAVTHQQREQVIVSEKNWHMASRQMVVLGEGRNEEELFLCDGMGVACLRQEARVNCDNKKRTKKNKKEN